MKLILLGLMFIVISGLLIISNNNLSFFDDKNILLFGEKYFDWITHVSLNFQIVGKSILELNWMPNP